MAAGLLAGAVLLPTTEVVAQSCKAPQPSICVRSCWGARAPTSAHSQMAALSRAIIHHTAGAGEYTTDYATAQSKMRSIQNYHMDSNGWSDIGYHFLVSAGGHVFEGRSGSMSTLPRGAHDGCNANSFGFTAMGYFHPPYNQAFTSTIQNALYNTIAWRMPTGWTSTGSGTYCGVNAWTLDGHRIVKATACPGDIIWAQMGNARSGVSSRRSCSTGKIAVERDNSTATFVGAWAVGSSAPDKYGADYHYKSTNPSSEPATWTANLNVTGSWTVRAWWADGANRSATAPYIVSHAAGSTTVSKNQQTGGGAWQTLGTWNMNSGANEVQLSCWTSTGFIVVADAIRWE